MDGAAVGVSGNVYVAQAVDEVAAERPARAVDEQVPRLVDSETPCVLIYNMIGEIGVGFLKVAGIVGDRVFAPDRIRLAATRAVDTDAPLADYLCPFVRRMVGESFGQILGDRNRVADICGNGRRKYHDICVRAQKS
jgi:hypothetical protein